MPLFSNRPFVPFLRNLVCSLDRLAVRNWFTLALDAATCASIGTDRGSSSAAAECVYPYMTSLHNQSGSTARYGTLPFFWIAVQRPLWVHYLLGLGLSVINCDLDIVWLNDARPHMIRTKGDLLLQGDTAAGLNSGFYLARPSERASAFFSVWLTDLENRGPVSLTGDLRGAGHRHACAPSFVASAERHRRRHGPARAVGQPEAAPYPPRLHRHLVVPLLYADGLLHHFRDAHLLRSESHDVCRLLQGYDMVTMHRYHSCSI
jgi:hypothetical protein